MKRREFTMGITCAGVGLAAVPAGYAQGVPVEGRHFVRLAQPAPVDLPGPDKKVEVVEFFWYECPHCNAFEPFLEAWAKRLPPDVALRQVPVGYTARHQLTQKMYYALETMGALQALHRRIFAAIHVQNRKLRSEAEIIEWVGENGVDRDKFRDAYRSFSVSAKANRATQITDAYKIEGVPALGIHGRFFTSGALAGSNQASLQVADFLIQRARSGG